MGHARGQCSRAGRSNTFVRMRIIIGGAGCIVVVVWNNKSTVELQLSGQEADHPRGLSNSYGLRYHTKGNIATQLLPVTEIADGDEEDDYTSFPHVFRVTFHTWDSNFTSNTGCHAYATLITNSPADDPQLPATDQGKEVCPSELPVLNCESIVCCVGYTYKHIVFH